MVDDVGIVKGTQGAAEEWDGTGIAARMVKSQPERRFGLYCAYPANRLDVAVAADGYQDFASPAAVEDGAWQFMAKSRQIGLWHAQGTENAGTCVESYIYRGPDWQVTGPDGAQQVIKAGDWLVGIIWEPEPWELVKSGVINGVSMQGTATRRKPSPEALAALRHREANQ